MINWTHPNRRIGTEKANLSESDQAMVLEFISSLPAILEGRDPHDEVYLQAHMEDATWTESAA